MTNPTPSQPHVVVFVQEGTNTLLPCMAPLRGGTIDKQYAIYPDRETADANVYQWSARHIGYFTVPASALFTMTVVPPAEPEYCFTRKVL